MFKHKVIGITAACLLAGGTVSPSLAQTAPAAAPTASQNTVTLLNEFRPIGGSGNNLDHPAFDAIPGIGEPSLASLNFAAGAKDNLIQGPNPRTISNVISGGTGAQGQTSTTTDPGASAWEYVFGQFVDHDLDLESNSPNGHAIDIIVPAHDPVFAPNSRINMTRDDRSLSTDTIINTTAGYLDLSQLYGSTTAVANSLRNADGTLTSGTNDPKTPIDQQTLSIKSDNCVFRRNRTPVSADAEHPFRLKPNADFGAEQPRDRRRGWRLMANGRWC